MIAGLCALRRIFSHTFHTQSAPHARITRALRAFTEYHAMSFNPWKNDGEGVGAPKSPSPARYPARAASEGKIHFEKSAPDAEILDPVPEKITYKTEIHPGDPVKEDRPTWKPRKHPNGRGKKNNELAIKEVFRQMDDLRPQPPAEIKYGDIGTQAFRDSVIAWVEAGGTITEFCKRASISKTQLYRSMKEEEGFHERLANARLAGYDSMAEEALRIASEPSMQAEEVITYDKDGNVLSRAVKRSDAVYARKLAFQARLQLLAKWAPNKYGEKVVQEDNESRATKILEARRRVANGDA